MFRTALEHLACPICGGDLQVTAARSEDRSHVLEGALACSGCDAPFPITRGVPDLRLPGTLESQTDEAFGFEWNRFRDVNEPELEPAQFVDWVHPVTEDQFAGKVVLDAGCGMGRWAQVVSGFGPRAVLAVDRSIAVHAAFERLRHLSRVHVVRGDILALPIQRGPRSTIDVGYSIGVLHHMPSPKEGFLALARAVKPDGTVVAWVYGREGNEWIERFVSPVRVKATSRMPKRMLDLASLGLSIPLHSVARAAHLTRAPIPYGGYLRWLGKYPFRHTHHIVFDHLAPEIAFYVSRGEIDEWLDAAGAKDAIVTPRNENSWRIVVTRDHPATRHP